MEEKYIKIKNDYECTGCRACEQICPVNCITMVEDIEGFIYPNVDKEKCINCGLCKRTCPQINKLNKENKDSIVYAMKPKKIENAKKSASGGIAYILSEEYIKNNKIIFGCEFNENLIANHIKVENKENLNKLRGSKYVFSDTKNTFREAKELLNKGKEVLYIGTPCQIAGLKNFLNKDYQNLITIDIVCHGVPSPKLFSKYIKYLEFKLKSKIIEYDFRNKEKAKWGEYYAKVRTLNKDYFINANEDPYYHNFLKGTIFRECCYKCIYANMNRVGDITLADFWGIEEIDSEFYNENGISLAIINTKKGEKVFEEIKEQTEYKEFSKQQASFRNFNLKKPTQRPKIRDNIYKNIDLKNVKKYISKNLKIKNKIKNKIKKLIPRKIKNELKQILNNLIKRG